MRTNTTGGHKLSVSRMRTPKAMPIHHRFLGLLLTAVVLVMGVVMSSSCVNPYFAIDPASKTLGYRLFTGKTEGLRISFEYPETWSRRKTEKHDTSEAIRLFTSDNSSISISSNVKASNGGEFENPSEQLQYSLDRDSRAPEFQLLMHTKVQLGQVQAEEVIYSYRFIHALDPHLPPGTVIDVVDMARRLAAEYRGRIYEVSLLVDADKYVSVREDFEHLVATFRFLD